MAQQSSIAVQTFKRKHSDFVPCAENKDAMAKYMEDHQLNFAKEHSYEEAFAALKKQHALVTDRPKTSLDVLNEVAKQPNTSELSSPPSRR